MESIESLAPGKLPDGPGKKAHDTFETMAAEQAVTLDPPSAKSEPISFWTLPPKTPTGGAPKPAGEFPEGSPTAFVLHRMIARGGCGEVWEATQTSMGRAVAVKRMRADVAHRGATTEWEFRQEAVTAAQLEHPNIVPVHDLGRDEAGRPVIAMKLVRGRAWSEVIREDFPLMSTPEFLGKHLPILMATTHAVAFAHSKGIVHRDLKPSQVMTGEFGEVLLMDWGLAIGSKGDSDTPPTFALPTGETASSPSGTPAYMAPEQTRSKATAVGTWTDVFLLGGILYELLTGIAPHYAETAEMAFRKACGGEIVPPRKRAPSREIPVELEVMCLRALAFKPEDRHPSARHFLDDLQDFASGSSRRREAMALVQQARASMEGAAGSYEKLGEAASLASRARQLWPEGTEARQLEEDATTKQAESALEKGDLVLARLLAGRVATGDRRSELLRWVAEKEAEHAGLERQRRFTLGLSFLLLGALAVSFLFYSRRIAAERDAAESARRDAASQRDRAVAALGETENLVQFMLGDLRERLAPRDPKLELLDAVAARAGEHYDSGKSSSATEEEVRARVKGLLALGEVLRTQGRSEDSEKRFGQARDLAIAMERERPADGYWRGAASAATEGVARTRAERGEYASAATLVEEDMAALRRAIAAKPQDPELLDAMISTGSWVAELRERAGKYDEAAAAWKDLIKLADELGKAQPDSPKPKIAMLAASTNLARLEERTSDPDRAIATLAAAVADYEKALPTLAPDKQTSGTLATALFRLGNMQLRKKDYAAAEKSALLAVTTAQSDADAHPGNLAVLHDLAVTLGLPARIYVEIGNVEQARKSVERQVAVCEALSERDPQNGNWMLELAAALETELRIVRLVGTATEVEAKTTRLREVLGRAKDLLPGNPMVALNIAQLDNAEGAAALRAGKMQEAIAKFRAVKDAFKPIGTAPEARLSDRMQYAATLANLAAPLEDTGAIDEALAAREEELAIRKEIGEAGLKLDPDMRGYTANCHAVAKIRLLLGRPAEAKAAIDPAVAYLESVRLTRNEDQVLDRRLGQQLATRARILVALGDAGAPKDAARSWELLKPLSEVERPDPFVLSAAVWALVVLDDRDAAKPLIPKLKEPAYDAALKAELEKRGWAEK